MRHLLVTTIAIAGHALAACECGFSVNRTDGQHTSEIFTEFIETDFLHVSDVSYTGIDQTGWIPQIWNATANQTRGTFGRSNELRNIIANPLPVGEWEGNGVHGSDPGLQLWVRHAVEDGQVATAELAHYRNDVLFGTFRAGIKTSGVNGTCSSFFWYRNDTQEIDVEYLSKQPTIVNTVLQSPASADAGFDAFKTKTSATFGSMFQLAEGYHEYRFDWYADFVQFYLDGQSISTFEENVPTAAGHLMLSHWSNGNPGWSVGPPLQDAVTTISYIKAYFNVASADDVKVGCPDPDQVCHISNDSSFLMSLPDSSGPGATPTTTAGEPLKPTHQGVAASRDIRASHVSLLWMIRLVIGSILW